MRLLLFLFLFVSSTVSGQTISWETIHLDNFVTFELPKGYSKTGDSEEQVFKVKGEYGNTANKFAANDLPSLLYCGFLFLILALILLIVKMPRKKNQVIDNQQ